jgi:hypothetical protein
MAGAKEEAKVSIEEAVGAELRWCGMDRDNLKELVAIIARLQRHGIKKVKVFPKGQPPIVDAVALSGIVDGGDAARVLGEILLQTPRMAGLRLFPYGIPWPEIFRVEVDLGAPVQAGRHGGY